MAQISLHLAFRDDQFPGGDVTPDTEVWLEIDGWAFPEKGWVERGAITVGQWCHALSELPEHGSSELDFIEGSYRVHLELRNDNICLKFEDSSGVLPNRETTNWRDFVHLLTDGLHSHRKELENLGKEAAVETIDKLLEFLRALD